MKIEQIADLPESLIKRAKSGKHNEAKEMADKIWLTFHELQGTDRGQIIDIRIASDGALPSTQELSAMDKKKRNVFLGSMRSRYRFLERELRSKTHNLSKYEVFSAYVGNGKVYFGWKYKLPKKVKKEEKQNG